MRIIACARVLAAVAALAACDRTLEPTAARAPLVGAESIAAEAGGVGAKVTGSGHVIRNLTGEDEMTTFAYSAITHADGSGSGHFTYHFRAADFSMQGHVTCVTVAGNTGWIGGVIDRVASDDPADQSFVGTDVWWLVEDNGQNENDPPDRTTNLLLTLPGTTITAASWCRDQPAVPVVPRRVVVRGNIQVEG